MRQHHVTMDEPIPFGGKDAGAAPLELLAASLTGCTNVIANRLASELGIALNLLKVTATLELDENVLSGAPIPAVFPVVRLTVEARSNATAEQMETLKARLAACCPVSVLFRQAGSLVIEAWDIKSDV